MKGKRPGSLVQFTCTKCSGVELVTGGTSSFVCSKCKPAGHYTLTAKYQAHKAVAQARKNGTLANPNNFVCVDCGDTAVEYDHRDYSKPLDVEPVCRRCNLRRGPAVGHLTTRNQHADTAHV